MKTMILTLSLTMASGVFAKGQFSKYKPKKKKQPVVRIAAQLSQSLQSLSVAAKKISKNAKQKGIKVGAKKFKRVAVISKNLSNKVENLIIKSVQRGSKKTALKHFKNMQHQFKKLNKAVQEIKFKTPLIKQKVQQVNRLRQLTAFALRKSVIHHGGHNRPYHRSFGR